MKSSVFKERRKNLADLILNNELYVPMKTKEIAILLGIPKELRHELQEVLDSLVADGTIGVSKKGKYMKPDNVALVGTFESTSRGFGFVVVDGQDDDIFVKASDTKDAFYHDKVKVVITAQKNGDRKHNSRNTESEYRGRGQRRLHCFQQSRKRKAEEQQICCGKGRRRRIKLLRLGKINCICACNSYFLS